MKNTLYYLLRMDKSHPLSTRLHLPIFHERVKIFGVSLQAHDDFFAFAFALISLAHFVDLVDGALEVVEQKSPISRAIVLSALLQSRRRIPRARRRSPSS